MVAILFCLLAVYAVSRLQVLDNAAEIKLARFAEGDHNASSMMHAVWNVVRLMLFVLMGVILVLRFSHAWYVVTVAMVMLNFMYSYVLRTYLNREMKWPEHYLGGTSYYDAFWISVGLRLGIQDIMHLHQSHWNDCVPEVAAGRKCWYHDHVLNRGRWACSFELVASVVGFALLVADHYV